MDTSSWVSLALFSLLLLNFGGIGAAWLHKKLPRKSSAVRECFLAALAALAVTAGPTFFVLWVPAAWIRPLAKTVQVPMPIAIGGSCFVVSFLALLWLRLRRPKPSSP